MRADDAARRVLDALGAVAATGRPPVLLIDGFSGAGKSTFADRLVALRPALQLVRLESIYPGWDGLIAASQIAHDDILVPLESGRPASWPRWDWVSGAQAERHLVDSSIPLIIEGVGALSRANRRLADLGVWVELDARARKNRALARDGYAYRPHWERWARQEREFADRERPRELADLEIDGRSLATMDR